MDNQKLTGALRSLQPELLDWRFALYNTSKGRDGLELEWNLCKINGAAAWVEILKNTLLEKAAAERKITEYSPFLSDKEHIGALEKTSGVIKDQIYDILANIRNGAEYAPEDFASGLLPKITGFAFYGESKDEQGKVKEQVLFMRRGNPFLTGNKTRLCISNGDTVVTCDKPLLKFTPATDFLYIDGICYFLSSAIEKDFVLESRHTAVAYKHLKAIADAEVINNYDQLEQVIVRAANAKKFMNFNIEILEHIVRLGVLEREEFLSKYGIEIDKNGRMDTYDPEQCLSLVDLLCCRTCIDPLGRLSIADNITPRE